MSVLKSPSLILAAFLLGILATLHAQTIDTLAPAPTPASRPASAPATNRFEKSVAAFEKSDRTNPPPAHPTLFIGSSTFTLWKTLPQDLADIKDLNPLNRAFGGSTFPDLIAHAPRTIFPYKPKAIVIYCGSNDIIYGASAQKVFDDFQTLIAHIDSEFPNTPIYFVSIAPCPSREKVARIIDQANTLIRDFAATHQNLHFIDVRFAFSTADHKSDPALYREDRIHLNRRGYEILIPILKKALGPPATQP